MASGSFQDCLLDATFPFEYDSDIPFADHATLLDATSQVLGNMTDVECYLPFADNTPFQPAVTTNVGALQEGYVTMMDIPVFQCAPQTERTSAATTQSPVVLPGMSHAALYDTHMQEVPVFDDSSNAWDMTANQDHPSSSTRPLHIRYPTTEDWNRHRGLFTKLYLEENKTLNEVKSILKEQYGFNATDKMYKKRINDWKLYKNCKASEKEEILRHVKTHKELGIDIGDPMLNGRMVKMHVLERHRKEKRKARSPCPNVSHPPSNIAEELSDSGKGVHRRMAAVSDDRLTKRARPEGFRGTASISFSRMDDPEEYRNCENLLFQVDSYYTSRLEKDPHATWNAWKKPLKVSRISYTFQGSNHTCSFDGNAVTVFGRYQSAILCLEVGRPRESWRMIEEGAEMVRPREAWRMIEEGAEMVRPFLMREPYRLLSSLLQLISTGCSSHYVRVIQHLLHLLSGMATLVLGERHPISNACRLLENLHEKQHVTELTLRKLQDVLERYLGKGHSASLGVRRTICNGLIDQRKYDEAERSLCELIKICERFLGRRMYQTRYALTQLVALYHMVSRNSEAEEIIEDVLQRCEECGKTDGPYIRARIYQAIICLGRGDYFAAESHSWSALSSSLLHFGPRDPYTISLWIDYEYLKGKQKAKHGTSEPPSPPQDPYALCTVTDEPLRCFSRPRSSSLPLTDNQDCKIGFCSEAPT